MNGVSKSDTCPRGFVKRAARLALIEICIRDLYQVLAIHTQTSPLKVKGPSTKKQYFLERSCPFESRLHGGVLCRALVIGARASGIFPLYDVERRHASGRPNDYSTAP